MFIQRVKELKLLNDSYDKPFSSLQVILGGKGIGKSSLLSYFSLGKRVLHISNYERIPNLFFSEMANQICKFFKNSSLDVSLKNFLEVLEYLDKQIVSSKTVIIFDDFQNILKYDKKAFDTLLLLWKEKLAKKNIQIVILSSIDFLNKNKYDKNKSSFTLIKLEALDFFSIEKFLPKLNRIEQLHVYSLLGTSSSHLKFYNEKLNFTENIYNLFLNTNSYLYDLGLNVLKHEINDIGTYCSILEAISNDKNRIGDIASSLNVKSTYLTRYIQKLMDMMIIKKEVPINEDYKKTKLGKYIINDNALQFWFLYVYPNTSLLEKADTKGILKQIEEKFIAKIVFNSYKVLIKEYVSKNQKNLLGYSSVSIGSWWDYKDNNIDLVAYDRSNITFIEILWQEKDMAKIAYGKLKILSSEFKTTLKKRYIIVSKETFLNIK